MIAETIQLVETVMDYPELARYAEELVGDNVDRVAVDSGVSRTTIYSIKKGNRARPDNYEKLALTLGKNRVEQREIFKRLMGLSGYYDLLPDDAAIDESLDALVIREIKARFPDVYAAAVAIVEARKRGDLPKTEGQAHR